MAERRMFAKTIIDSDAFLDMPLSTQALYFHLSMRADDEGFINNPKKIQRMVGASEDDLKLLMAKNFIIPFDSGIVVIKHWKIHNYIRGDRIKKTIYKEEAALLHEKDSGAYTLTPENTMSVICQSSDSQMSAQVRLGKDRLGKVSKEDKGVRHKHGEYKNVLLSDEDLAKLQAEFPNDWSNRIERLSSYMASTGKSYKNHLATIRNWAKRDASSKEVKPSDEDRFYASLV